MLMFFGMGKPPSVLGSTFSKCSKAFHSRLCTLVIGLMRTCSLLHLK